MADRDDKAPVALSNQIAQFLAIVLVGGAGLFLVLLLGQWFRPAAVVGIVVFAVVLLINVYRTAVALVLGLVLLIGGTSAEHVVTQKLMWMAKFVLVMRTVVSALYVWLLYWFFFAN